MAQAQAVVHEIIGNQTDPALSILRLAIVPLAVERAGTATDLPLQSSCRHRQSMMFPLTSDDVYPGAMFHRAGIFMRGCLLTAPPEAAQPIALRMASISLR